MFFLLDNTLPDLSPPVGTPETQIPVPAVPPRTRAQRAQKRRRDHNDSDSDSDEMTGDSSPVIDLGVYTIPE